MEDLISVIIPAYNHEIYVQDTINSIINQSYQNIELIIVDDGSKDSTFEKIKELKDECTKRFKRVIIKSQPNAGTCATLNRLLQLSTGKFVYLIASDDIAKPHAIEVLHNFLSNNKDYALAVGDSELINENSTQIYWDDDRNVVYDRETATCKTFIDLYKRQRPEIDFNSSLFGEYETLIKGNYVPNGYLIRKSIFNTIGMFTPEAPLEDFWLMLQISKYAQMKYLDTVLFSYRWHSTNTSHNNEKMIDITVKTIKNESKVWKTIEEKINKVQSARKDSIKLFHNEALLKLKDKVKENEKIRVAFFVVLTSVFPGRPLFELMLKDDIFDPCIVVIPDTSRGIEKMFSHLKSSYQELSSQYDNVHFSYNFSKKEFIDFKNQIDIVCFANPYDPMTQKCYGRAYYCDKLSFYIPYGYSTSNWYKNIEQNEEIPFWKTFAASKQQKEVINDDSAVLIGYPKMDAMAAVTRVEKPNKTLIIAPHHTVSDWKHGVNYSNFLSYSDFFLKLPKLYPDINFIFRPHPLLFINLVNNNIWEAEKLDNYVAELTSNKNVVYDTSSNYFDTFINSDGLIHDCGSFMGEYLFTQNPCLYLLKDTKVNDANFNEFAQECIAHHYHGYSEQDIINFINNIIIAKTDPMKEQRRIFFEEKLKLNYPDTSKKILNYLKSELL